MSIAIILKIIILGIVEGITEWLPISSTGHLILVGNLLKLDMSAEFVQVFNIVIQLGAILAVVVLFFKKLWPFHSEKIKPVDNWFANPVDQGFTGKFQKFANKYLYMDKVILWLKIVVSSIPCAIIGLPLDDWMEEHLHKPVPVALMLIIYGVLFIVIENFNSKRKPSIKKLSQITWKIALIIGLFQALSMIPGTSRSGATILGGIIIGLSRTAAAEYTFFLAIPAMFGASFVKLLKFGFHFTSIEAAALILGMAVSFVVSIITIKFLLGFIKKHDFKVFGCYRIVLGILVLVLSIAGILF